MSNNHNHKHKKIHNFNNNLTKNILLLNNMSTDFGKTSKIINANYLNQKNLLLNSNTNANINVNNTNKQNNINNNNYIHEKNIFQNTKLYNVVKPTKYIKKRNYSNTLLHNNLITSSLTEGNINGNTNININTNTNIYQKKYNPIFHSKTLNLKNRTNPKKNNYLNNNNKNKQNINNILHNSNSFKLLSKSKSNIGFIKQPQYKNLIINTQEKNTTNNRKIFSTIGQINNLRIKTIKNNSGINNQKIINYNINNTMSNKNSKLSDSIPKKSGDNRENRENKENINILKKEIDNYKKELNNKEEIIQKQIIKINKLNNNYENCQNNLKNTQKLYDDLKIEYQEIKNNYSLVQDKISEYEKNINIMKKKEIKLMKVLYLIKERGIDLNSILNEVNQITFHEISATTPSNIKNENCKNNNNDKIINDDDINDKNENNNINNSNNYNIDNNSERNNIVNESRNSDLTVYFPDKIKMNNIMETKTGQNIPKLNFGYVPEYSSDSDSQQNNIIYHNTLMEEENLYFPKFTKFQNSA